MTPGEKDDVRYRIDEEGFEYAMCDYSDWKEIHDEKFHELLSSYRNARDEILEYLNTED